MEEDRSDELLTGYAGTEQVDKFQAWATENAKKAGEWYKDASADQAGIGDDILRLLGGGAKNVAWASELPGIKQGFQALDALSYYGGKVGGAAAKAVGVDPRIGGAIGNVTGEVLTGFGTKALVTKGARVGKYTKALSEFTPMQRSEALTFVQGADGHVAAARAIPNKLSANLNIATRQVAKETGEEIVGTLDWLKTKPFVGRSRLARQNVANKDFINKLEGQTDEMVTWAKSNNNSLDNYPGIRTIELPDGRAFRLEPSGKTGEAKFSWKSMKAADNATAKRLQSTVLDDQTLKRHLVTDSAVQSYTAMNQTVRTKIKSAITRYNNGLPKKDRISLEHIFDVQHYGRMKLKVNKFSGKGADELGNLTVLGAGKNYSTGALAKNIDSGDALVDLIKQDKFIDYIQTTSDFKKHNLAEKVKNFTNEDWDLFTQTAINNREKNLHQILIEQITGKKTKPTQFPDNIQRHIKRSQEIGIPEPQWKSGSIDYTWRPQSGTGQIDIPPQSAKGFKGLRDEFFKQIEELPSGSVWELNPKFKDEQRRRIYARLFGKDARITRNPDETLGWVLTVP